MAWSRDGRRFAIGDFDGVIDIWDKPTWRKRHTFRHGGCVTAIVWSPDDKTIASTGVNGQIRFWDPQLGKLLGEITAGRASTIVAADWANKADGYLAYSTELQEIVLWNVDDDRAPPLVGHNSSILCLTWSPDGNTLASGTESGSVGIWKDNVDNQLRLHYPDHSAAVRSLAWQPNSSVLASGSEDGTIRIRDTESNLVIAILDHHREPVVGLTYNSDGHFLVSKALDDTIRIWETADYSTIASLNEPSSMTVSGISANPYFDQLASHESADNSVHIWQLGYESLARHYRWLSYPYRNAKVLVYEACDGCLDTFRKRVDDRSDQRSQESNVVQLDRREVHGRGGSMEVGQIILWNWAGKFVHSQFEHVWMKGAALAIFLFDVGATKNPETSLKGWQNKLRALGKHGPRLLVIALDRRTPTGQEGQETNWQQRLGVDLFTVLNPEDRSAVVRLEALIYEQIDWRDQFVATSTALYADFDAFASSLKEGGRLISSSDDLQESFLSKFNEIDPRSMGKREFENCLKLVENTGSIRTFTFNRSALFLPEYLYTYINAMYLAARTDEYELGRLDEDRARAADINIADSERIDDETQEQMLLIAIILMLEEEGLILRVSTTTGSYLLFPTETKREYPYSERTVDTVSEFKIEGAVDDVYAQLITRAAGSTVFRDPELWRGVAFFDSPAGGRCGVMLEKVSSQEATLRVVLKDGATDVTRQLFRDFVRTQLELSALTTKTAELETPQETIHNPSAFVCYNTNDRDDVRGIVTELKKEGINLWFDEWDLRPGESILAEIQHQAEKVEIILFFAGAHGTGLFQEHEWEALMQNVIYKGAHAIPVLLPNYNEAAGMPAFLKTRNCVDFRRWDPNPLEQLKAGIQSVAR